MSEKKIILVLASNFDAENTDSESYTPDADVKFSLEEFEKILDDIKPTTARLQDFKKKAWGLFP